MPALPSLDVLHTPYYMEAELNSPMVHLAPGEAYTFSTQWFPARVGDRFKTVNDAGVVSNPMKVTRTTRRAPPGGFLWRLLPRPPGRSPVRQRGGPRQRCGAHECFSSDFITLDRTIDAPPTVAWLSIHLEDAQGRDTGALDQAHVNPQESIQLK